MEVYKTLEDAVLPACLLRCPSLLSIPHSAPAECVTFFTLPVFLNLILSSLNFNFSLGSLADTVPVSPQAWARAPFQGSHNRLLFLPSEYISLCCNDSFVGILC